MEIQKLNMNFYLTILFILLISTNTIHSNETYIFEDKPITKKEVVIGIYIKQIYGFTLVEQKFDADFYLWFRWSGEDYNPMDHFILEKGVLHTKEGSYFEKKKDGSFYGYTRVIATFNQRFDINDFPFDSHRLIISIEEENESNLVEYVIDKSNSKLDNEIFFSGYKINNFIMETKEALYDTNYGDLELETGKKSKYSRATFSLDISREGFTYFIKLMIGAIISTLISLLSFFIKPINLDPRFGLGVGGLFGVIASEFVILSTLPPMSIITIADLIHILSLLYIITSIIISIVSLRFYENGKVELSIKIDKYSILILFPLYFIMIFLIIFIFQIVG